MRVTVPASSLVTQIAPAPAAIAVAFTPRGICARGVPRPISIRRTLPSAPETTHSAPAATASDSRRVRGRDPLQDLVRARIDLGDVAPVAVRHPQRAGAERERGRARRRPG